MSISDKIAGLNHDRFSDFSSQPAKAAGWSFDGPAHKALDIDSLSPDQQSYAQEHIITLSGLYGYLRPYDALRPYRLEMGTKLKTKVGNTLYEFWGAAIAKELARELKAMPEEQRFVVNVASQEYWNVIGKHEEVLGAPVYTINFPGPSVYAKQARGAFCRFMCEAQVETPDQLKEFAAWSTAGGGPAKYKLVASKGEFESEFHRTGENNNKKKKATGNTKGPAAKKQKKGQ